MELIPVKDVQDPQLPFIRELYENSFPLHERREWEQVLQLLDVPARELLLIKDGELTVGFLIRWKIDNWHYVEHFAIDPQLRGKEYGTKVIRLIIASAASFVLLEVEKEHDNDSARRIRFYERAGFTLAITHYEQPPYRKGETTVPMYLMCYPAIPDRATARMMAALIKDQVYERFY